MDSLCTDRVHLLDTSEINEENINDVNNRNIIHNDTVTHTHSATVAVGIAVSDGCRFFAVRFVLLRHCVYISSMVAWSNRDLRPFIYYEPIITVNPTKGSAQRAFILHLEEMTYTQVVAGGCHTVLLRSDGAGVLLHRGP